MFVDQRKRIIFEHQEKTFNQRLALVGVTFTLLLLHVIRPEWGLAVPTLSVTVPLFLLLMHRSQKLKIFKAQLDSSFGIHTRRRLHSAGQSTEKWQQTPHHTEILKDLTESAQNLSRDLDLAGPYSVVGSFDETFTPEGCRVLLNRCLEPSLDLGHVRQNQSEIRKLSSFPGAASKFLTLGQTVFDGKTSLVQMESLLSQPIFDKKFRLFPVFLVGLWLLAAFLVFASDSEPQLAKYSVIFPVLSLVSLAFLKRGFHEMVGLTTHLQSLIPVVAQAAKLQKILGQEDHVTVSWLSSIRGLTRALGFLSVNSHPLVVVLLNLILPWNWLASFWAERHRSRISGDTGLILQAIYHLESACSLALFSRRPNQIFPTVGIGEELAFEELYHPSQNPLKFTPNSFLFPQGKTLVLITGSNMSGKSTFLRTLGAAQMLALAGASLPCRSFRTGLFKPLTCLRVSDSLRDGASYFFAEVQRLKWILDQLKEGSLSLVLIDEIFRGTNNRERLIGSHSYVKALLKERAKSFVTTHDLELTAIEADEPGLANMHFSDNVSHGKMTFDYKIRPGASPTTNALKIMSLVGLPVELPT